MRLWLCRNSALSGRMNEGIRSTSVDYRSTASMRKAQHCHARVKSIQPELSPEFRPKTRI